ncbi:MAG TPA: YfhO family protein [Bacteroidota bacterium]|nr:YfhO family protein [Bacteroidota bacterium]
MKKPTPDHPLVPERYQHATAIALIFASLIIFFHELVFEGKVFVSPDDINPQSFSTLLEDARKEGIYPLWNPYIFCGMPGYASLTYSVPRTFDLLSAAMESVTTFMKLILLNEVHGWQIFYYAVLAIGVYLLVFHKLKQKIPAVVAALGVVFSMHIIAWSMIGHGTKILTFAFLPYIFLFTERIRQRFTLLDLILLTIALHFAFAGGHVQMLFYMGLAIGISLLFLLVRGLLDLRKAESPPQELPAVLKAGGFLVVAAAVAFLTVSDRYLSVLEYNPYSIRGSNPIAQTFAPEAKGKEGGLDYEYATNWSMAPGEFMTWIIPSWYGFGWHSYRGPITNNEEVRLNTYWGPQPFTDAPPYMGITLLVLAIIGTVLNRKDRFVQFAILMIGLSVFVAFGKEFPIVYDLMYHYLPMFNKFRVPSMILVLAQFLVPILAAYGLASLLHLRSQSLSTMQLKRWRNWLIGLGVALFISVIGRSVVIGIYSSFFPPDHAARALARSYGNLQPAVFQELHAFVARSVATDLTFALFGLLVVFGGLWLYIRQKISLNSVVALIIVAVLFDLWRVAYKPMETHEPGERQEAFIAPEHVRYLLQQMEQDPTPFRVLEFINGQPPYSNILAYWRIQSAYGYQGAKPRAYQDMVDVVGLRNPVLWQLMNVKYIISNQPDTTAFLGLAFEGRERKVYVNRLVYPRAFFVNRYEVAGGLEILNKIAQQEFNPKTVAYFLEDPKLQIDPSSPQNTVEFVRYGTQDLTLKVTASGNNLLFLSEAYYPEGWKAYLDGNEIPIYRVNYLFRGVVVPAGTHTLEMKFEPKGFYLGKNLSLAANFLVIVGLTVVGFQEWRKRKSSM